MLGGNPETGPFYIDGAYPGAWLYLGVSEGTAAPIFVLSKRLDLVPGTNELRCLIEEVTIDAAKHEPWLIAEYELA